MPRSRSNYSFPEVRRLVEEYLAHRAKANTNRTGLPVLVQLADLDRALARMPDKHWGPVLVHGLLGVPLQEAAAALRISHQALSKRYRRGLEDIHYWINGVEE